MSKQLRYPEQYIVAGELEQYLGDPSKEETVFSFKRAVEQDEREEFPEQACALLDGWGVNHYYIPVEHGGKLASFEQLLVIIRVIGRRDLTVAVAHVKTYLGAVAVWEAGDEKQTERLARLIKNGNAVALGLTERTNGSDILASETTARETADGYLLSGEKWLINNATRGDALTIFARTDGRGGTRGFSMFLVEKSCLAARSYSHHPKIKTHGIRGADISGIRFDDCLLPAESLVGGRGAALEVTLKGFQLTRIIVAGLSLGAGDTALRTTLRFALARRLHRGTVFEIPHARSLLVDAYIRLLVCECTAIAATRGIHVATEQLSLWSAVVKYFVPTTVEKIMATLSVVLGARHYLREEHDWGIFQKFLRDNAIASVFDGSTVVNLNVIAQQLRTLAEYGRKAKSQSDEDLRARLEALFGLTDELPPFQAARQELFNRGRDDVRQGMKIALARLADAAHADDLDPQVSGHILNLANELGREITTLDEQVKALPVFSGNIFNQSPEWFELAQRHCALHAAAACLHLWMHNRAVLGGFFAGGEWLALALDKCLGSNQPGRVRSLPAAFAEHVARQLVKQFEADELFSLIPFELASTEKL